MKSECVDFKYTDIKKELCNCFEKYLSLMSCFSGDVSC